MVTTRATRDIDNYDINKGDYGCRRIKIYSRNNMVEKQ